MIYDEKVGLISDNLDSGDLTFSWGGEVDIFFLESLASKGKRRRMHKLRKTTQTTLFISQIN